MSIERAAMILRLSLAFVWILTGAICLSVPSDGLDLIERVGIQGMVAEWIIRLVSALEVLLGVLLVVGAWPRLLSMMQIILIVGFTAVVTVRLPEFWMHPFGPVSKNVVLIAAAVVAGQTTKN
jgi:uncharacterized membrane protein YphA (DoxX/SURF4 family)